jgi:phenylacetic acid degradation protein
LVLMPVYSIDGVVPVVPPSSFVHPDAVLIGDVIIGERCYVGANSTLRGDFGRVVVGDGANVQDGCVLHAFPGLECVLESDAHIGHGAVLHGCKIREGALVGINAVVMDDAVIGRFSFVAAGSFVPEGAQIAERVVVAGVPVRERRALSEDELRWKANGTRLYQLLAARSLRSLVRTEPLDAPEVGRARMSTTGDAALPLHRARSGGRYSADGHERDSESS